MVYIPEVILCNYYFIALSAPEGKRSSGLTAVWVARNRFAVLDRMHSVSPNAGLRIFGICQKN